LPNGFYLFQCHSFLTPFLRRDWKWSSLPGWFSGDALLWRGEVVVRDERWLERVNEPLSLGDLQRLRLSVARGQPYGEESWAKETARRLGLESTLRSRGRPRKTE
jgi:putative transposase